jgi:calcineurin-like phosphoesterase family protein
MKFSKLLKNNTVWITSDTHWGHSNILTFKDINNVKIRPWDNILQMEHDMIELWNQTVEPHHYVVHLGDVAMNNTGYERVMPHLNGRKILIQGNHDSLSYESYAKYFQHIFPMLYYSKTALLTHVPIHPDSLGSVPINIHGHLHNNVVKDANNMPDKRYVCACVEQTQFKPVLFTQLVQNALAQLNMPEIMLDNTNQP